jgi:hypothetical protein
VLGSERETDCGARVVAHLRGQGGDVAMTTNDTMSLMRGEPPFDTSRG